MNTAALAMQAAFVEAGYETELSGQGGTPLLTVHSNGVANVIDPDRLEGLTPEQLAWVARNLPYRVIVRKGEDGAYEGVTEESFCMATHKQRARLWWSGKAYSILGEHVINGVDDAKHNAKKPGDVIYDPLAPDSIVRVDWPRRFNKDLPLKSKFSDRNAVFTVKEQA